MRLSAHALNRTLLRRQGPLERQATTVRDVCRRLVGPQAQENLSPFVEDGRVRVLETLRPLSRRERSELDDEITRVEVLLARR